jgi:hypothetical protein
MIRARIVASLIACGDQLGNDASGSTWHLFGSVDRDDLTAHDIDLLILCENDAQSDRLRCSIDEGAFELPLHLSLMTFEENFAVGAVEAQQAHQIYPPIPEERSVRSWSS